VIFEKEFLAARAASTPLIAVEAVDGMQVLWDLVRVANSDPVVVWDCAAGPRGANLHGKDVAAATWARDRSTLRNLFFFLGGGRVAASADPPLFIRRRMVEKNKVPFVGDGQGRDGQGRDGQEMQSVARTLPLLVF